MLSWEHGVDEVLPRDLARALSSMDTYIHTPDSIQIVRDRLATETHEQTFDRPLKSPGLREVSLSKRCLF